MPTTPTGVGASNAAANGMQYQHFRSPDLRSLPGIGERRLPEFVLLPATWAQQPQSGVNIHAAELRK